jgi:hypothetical protein
MALIILGSERWEEGEKADVEFRLAATALLSFGIGRVGDVQHLALSDGVLARVTLV